MTAAVHAAIHGVEIPQRYLTKSLVRCGLKCPRKLVYATSPNLYPQSRDHVDDPLLKHLSNEGVRFGEYCKRLFPHGVEIGKVQRRGGIGDPSSLEHLVAQTHQTLMSCPDESHRVTVFEGAIRYASFYAQPDILDMFVKSGEESSRIELRVIEVKSKSWDSRHTVEEKMWTDKNSIRATFLPYIQDIAFQSMVCRLVYPDDVNVSSWLMMPDRAKKMVCSDPDLTDGMIHTVEDTMQAIDDSIASLVNVDELVERALTSEVSYPGSKKGETFEETVTRWAEQLNHDNFGPDSFSSPIGMQCSSCEYRLKDPPEGTYSGFDHCWQAASGLTREVLQNVPLINDLYGNTKKDMNIFLSGAKYTLSDLTESDLFRTKEDCKMEKRGGGEIIKKFERQWYHVETTKRSAESDANLRPRCIIKRSRLKQISQDWKYPLHFIDFETVSPPIPLYSNMSPYEIFAFQFSHHTLHHGSSEVHHASEFLHTEEGPPIVSFLKALHEAICCYPDGGTVFQWSPHEHNVLKEMLSSPEASASLSSREFSALSALLDNGMVDLCKLAQKYYYVDGSDGSSSIKKLLQPTLQISDHLKKIYGSPTYNSRNFSNFQWYQIDDGGRVKDPYDILSTMSHPDQHGSANVTKGGAAAAAFHELQNDLDDGDRSDIENSLLRYCELDTLAMVMIVQAWQGLLDDPTS
ncbi:hypothetical protein ACHAW5_007494 [Stephanodiscus triporus]|uniref:DUF2779 domain-containing protein n=1 Tax=Stephanodiscus triporus TaxID=2934178 RepID=A0ABD3NP95_9STRA